MSIRVENTQSNNQASARSHQTDVKQYYRELLDVQKRISNYSAEVSRISFPDESNLHIFEVEMTPTSGHFRDCVLTFVLNCHGYPNSNPQIACKDQIYHPNVASDRVCLHIDTVDSHVPSLETIINAIRWLLDNPGFDSPLVSDVRGDTYAEKVREMVRGGERRCGRSGNLYQYSNIYRGDKSLERERLEDSWQRALECLDKVDTIVQVRKGSAGEQGKSSRKGRRSFRRSRRHAKSLTSTKSNDNSNSPPDSPETTTM